MHLPIRRPASCVLRLLPKPRRPSRGSGAGFILDPRRRASSTPRRPDWTRNWLRL